jgi:DNA repair protein RadA/Sms
MARSGPRHVCRECGHEALAWTGRCPECGEWNTLVEEARPARARGAGERRGQRSRASAARPVPLSEVAAADVARHQTGIGELDRVLGGGIVPGSLVLLGGSPGIGKSTVAAMALGNLASAGRRTLYVSGEESAAQVRLRAERLGERALAVPVIAETGLAEVVATIEAERPQVCIVDSVQTLHAEGASGAPGSVAQVREAAGALMVTAKRLGVAVIVVGHVTKEGSLAGPRALEHLVDCVLMFEGERERSYRTLRALKNRFGATSEVAVFEMRSGGLTEVTDPSARFVGEAAAVPGSCVLCAMEGTRPLLVEVQALVAPTEIVPPRRIATGIDRNRLSLVLAVLARHGRISLASADVFVNVAGGVRVEEPGADLAVALALASAHRGEALRGSGSGNAGGGAAEGGAEGGGSPPCACFGEIGLTGELRYVAHPERRVAEALKFGLGSVIAPPSADPIEGLDPHPSLERALRSAFATPMRKAA